MSSPKFLIFGGHSGMLGKWLVRYCQDNDLTYEISTSRLEYRSSIEQYVVIVRVN